MKKWALVCVFMLLAVPAFSAQLKEEIVPSTTLSKTNIVTGGSAYTGDSKRVSFFVAYDSSDTTTGVTANVTASFSYDGVNWTPACWYDTDGGVTPQTEQILTRDETYAGWFPPAPIPYIRIGIKMVNTAVYGASEQGTVSVDVVKDE
jgi:hypothetical protein